MSHAENAEFAENALLRARRPPGLVYDDDNVNDDEDYLMIVRYYKSTDDTDDTEIASRYALVPDSKPSTLIPQLFFVNGI